MIEIRVTGAEQVVVELEQIPPRSRSYLTTVIQKITNQLHDEVQRGKLEGQVLKHRSGRLSQSIHAQVKSEADVIEGIVGTNVEYARAHEYGFNGQVSVRAHLRKITEAFGRVLDAPVEAQVQAHSRHMRLPKRSFLRSTLEEHRSEIHRLIEAAVARAVQESGGHA